MQKTLDTVKEEFSKGKVENDKAYKALSEKYTGKCKELENKQIEKNEIEIILKQASLKNVIVDEHRKSIHDDLNIKFVNQEKAFEQIKAEKERLEQLLELANSDIENKEKLNTELKIDIKTKLEEIGKRDEKIEALLKIIQGFKTMARPYVPVKVI